MNKNYEMPDVKMIEHIKKNKDFDITNWSLIQNSLNLIPSSNLINIMKIINQHEITNQQFWEIMKNEFEIRLQGLTLEEMAELIKNFTISGNCKHIKITKF